MSSDPQGSEFKKAGLQDDDKKVHVSFIKKDLVVEEGEAKVVSVSAVVPLGQEDPSASPGPADAGEGRFGIAVPSSPVLPVDPSPASPLLAMPNLQPVVPIAEVDTTGQADTAPARPHDVPSPDCQACGRECGVRFEMCDAIGMTDVHLVCVECFSGVTNRSGPLLPMVGSAEDVSAQSSPVDQPDLATNYAVSWIPSSALVLVSTQASSGDAGDFSRGQTISSGQLRRVGSNPPVILYAKGAPWKNEICSLLEALNEVCANRIYQVYGCEAQKLGLTVMPWLPGSEMFLDGDSAAEGMHVLTEWIPNFTVFGSALVNALRNPGVEHFPSNGDGPAYQRTLEDVLVFVRERWIPVVGLGRILAVSLLLHDVDCVGGGGGNTGFVVQSDESCHPVSALAIKIDPGMAMHQYSEQTNGRDRHDLRHPSATSDTVQFYANASLRFSVSNLPARMRDEFREAVNDIVFTDPATFGGWFNLSTLPFQVQDVAKQCFDVKGRCGFLAAGVDALRTKFASLLSRPPAQVRQPVVDVVREVAARYTLTATVVDPVAHTRLPAHSAINLAILRAAGPGEAVQPLPIMSFGNKGTGNVIVRLDDLMDRCKTVSNGNTRRVNMIGGPGFGKSTACSMIARGWAENGLFRGEYPLVLWFPLRNLNEDRYPLGNDVSLATVVIRECLDRVPTEALVQIVVSQLSSIELWNTLWILDGHDEIAGRVPPHLQRVYTELMSLPCRVLTGRPHAMLGIPCDLLVEVVGFTDADIVQYLERFLTRHALSSHSASALSAAIATALRAKQFLWDMVHVPINLTLISHVLFDQNLGQFAETALSTMDSLTSVYQQLDGLMMRRFCDRMGIDAADVGRRAEVSRCVNEMLCTIAVQATREGLVVMSGASIVKWVPQVNWDALLKSGILTAADVRHGGPPVIDYAAHQYTFLHLSIQEHYTAKGLVHLWAIRTDGNRDVCDWFTRNRLIGRLELCWRFVGGVLGSNETSDAAFQRFLDTWAFNRSDHCAILHQLRVMVIMCDEGRLWSQPQLCTLVEECMRRVAANVKPELSTCTRGHTPVSEWASALTHCGAFWAESCVRFLIMLPLCFSSSCGIPIALALAARGQCLRILADPLVSALESTDLYTRSAALRVLRAVGDKCLASIPLHDWVLQSLRKEELPVDVGTVLADLILSLGEQFVHFFAVDEYLKTAVRTLPIPWVALRVIDGLGTAFLSRIDELRGICPLLLSPDTTVEASKLFGAVHSSLVCRAECAWISEAIKSAVVDGTGLVFQSGVRILTGLGSACLELDWIQSWLSSCFQSPHAHDWVPAANVLVSIGGKGSLGIPGVANRFTWACSHVHHGEWEHQYIAFTTFRVFGSAVKEYPALVNAIMGQLITYDRNFIARDGLTVLWSFGTELWDVPGFIPIFQELLELQTWSWELRLAIVQTVQVLGVRAVKHPLVSKMAYAVIDSDADVRNAGVTWLVSLGREVANIPWLKSWITDVCASGNTAHRSTLRDALALISCHLVIRDDFSTVFEDMLSNDDDPEIALLAAESFVSVGLTALSCDCFRNWLLCHTSNLMHVLPVLKHLGTGSVTRPQLWAHFERVFAKPVDVEHVELHTAALQSLMACGVNVLCRSSAVEYIQKCLVSDLNLCRDASDCVLSLLQSLKLVEVSDLTSSICGQCFQSPMLEFLLFTLPVEFTTDSVYISTASSVLCQSLAIPSDVRLSIRPEAPLRLMASATVFAPNGSVLTVNVCLRLRKHMIDSPTDVDKCLQFCETLRSYCRLLGSNRVMIGRELLPVLFTVMGSHSGVESIQESACTVIAKLCKHADNRVRILDSGGFPLILSCMESMPSSVGVQAAACAALRYLALNDTASVRIVNSSALQRVYAAIAMHIKVEDVVLQVAGALRKLACNAINKVTIVGTGGLTALYSAMDAWPSNAAIQYQCVNALRSLASNYSPQNKVIIFDGGGVPRVLRAMDVHSTVPKVQEKACGFLKDITDSAVGPGGGKMHERLSDSIAFARVAREFVCASGGLERIAAALDNHEGLASVQHWALWALASIAQDSCFHHPLQERGFLPRLCRAMTLHPSSPTVQDCACETLYWLLLPSLSAPQEPNPRTQQLCELNAPSLIVGALVRLPRAARVQRWGCAALGLCSTLHRESLFVIVRGTHTLTAPSSLHTDRIAEPLTIPSSLRLMTLYDNDSHCTVQRRPFGLQLAAMSSLPLSVDVQEAALTSISRVLALSALRRESSTGGDSPVVVLDEVGQALVPALFPLISTALAQHGKSTPVVMAVCALINHVADMFPKALSESADLTVAVLAQLGLLGSTDQGDGSTTTDPTQDAVVPSRRLAVTSAISRLSSVVLWL